MHELHQLREAEQRLLGRLHERGHVARDVHAEDLAGRTLGERLADDLAHFAGSWRFILLFLGACAFWAFLNVTELVSRAWDPYPFILLNLFLSLLAGLQAPVIMMSQNRQEERDRLRSQADYEVNLKAELEIEQLHGKMDELREERWAELLAIQQQQIHLLHQQIALLQRLSPSQGVGETAASEASSEPQRSA